MLKCWQQNIIKKFAMESKVTQPCAAPQAMWMWWVWLWLWVSMWQLV